MDLLKLLNEKAQYFSASENDRGISSVVSHIKIAEKHYEGGKSGDDYLFNDVIYRSNQAFEGALKEAYRIITKNDSNNITPHKIEKYFEENNLLKDRVLQLFTNYRMEWRNKSTHDHNLYFSEQEAFLAIVNISAFINILFDQMIERRAYDTEVNDLKNRKQTETPWIKSGSLLDSVLELLKLYSLEVPGKVKGTAMPRITEIEIFGSLTAFINSAAKDIEVVPEYQIISKNKRKYIADFLLRQGEEKLIIEVKNSSHDISTALSRGMDQLVNYLIVSGVTQGIIYIPPMREGLELGIVTYKFTRDDIIYQITQIFPKNTET